MRNKGLDYKVNFGLSVPQIKELARRYQPDKELADTLWKEETRELKILATLLYPADNLAEDAVDTWVRQTPNQEIREQLCINLLQNLSFAPRLALQWSNMDDANMRITGYWLLTRLLITQKITLPLHTDSLEYIYADILSEDFFMRNAALLALKHIGRQSEEEADSILKNLLKYKNSQNAIEQEAYNSLSFEFGFFFGN